MTLTQLRCFQMLARTQHYRKASEQLYISQPALSKCIRQLENELGVKLFEKEGRNVMLTGAGNSFLQYVDAALSSLDDGLQAMKHLADLREREMSIACVTSAVLPYLAPMLESFRQQLEKLPGEAPIRLRTWSGMSFDLLQGLEKGKYDVAFCSRLEQFKTITFVPVCELPLVVVVKRGDPLAAVKILEPAQLNGRDMLFTASLGYSDFIRQVLAYYNVSYRETGSSNEDTVLIGMVEAGQGIFISNDYPQIHTEKTSIIPLRADAFHRYIYMAYDAKRSLSPLTQSLIAFNEERKLESGNKQGM